MKDVLSAFSSELFRPLVTLVLPGIITITPYFIVFMQKWRTVREMVAANRTETAIVLLIVALFFGLVIEDLGAMVETKIFDRLAQNKNSRFGEVWWSYMSHTFDHEPPGRNYLRALVIRLKFELGSAIAPLSAIRGVFLIDLPIRDARWWISAAASILICYLVYEARATHRVLGKLRERLIEGDLKAEAAT